MDLDKWIYEPPPESDDEYKVDDLSFMLTSGGNNHNPTVHHGKKGKRKKGKKGAEDEEEEEMERVRVYKIHFNAHHALRVYIYIAS